MAETRENSESVDTPVAPVTAQLLYTVEIQGIRNDMNQRFDRVEQRFAQVNQRFAQVKAKIDNLRTDVDTKIDSLRTNIHTLQGEVTRQRYWLVVAAVMAMLNWVDIDNMPGVYVPGKHFHSDAQVGWGLLAAAFGAAIGAIAIAWQVWKDELR